MAGLGFVGECVGLKRQGRGRAAFVGVCLWVLQGYRVGRPQRAVVVVVWVVVLVV